jgi:hypothetical protein
MSDVGLLFVRFDGKSRRMRINRRASILDDAEAKARHFGAQRVVRIECEIYPNCPRYVRISQGKSSRLMFHETGRERRRRNGNSATTSATSCQWTAHAAVVKAGSS